MITATEMGKQKAIPSPEAKDFQVKKKKKKECKDFIEIVCVWEREKEAW